MSLFTDDLGGTTKLGKASIDTFLEILFFRDPEADISDQK